MTTDFADWDTSADRALKIFNQTVPLGRKPVGVASNSSAIAANGTSTLVNAVSITQPSFHMLIGFSWPGAAVPVPFIALTFKWTDAASGFQVASDQAIIPGGVTVLDFHYLCGPARADTLTVTAQNLDAANLVSFSFGMSQSSHVYQDFRLMEVGSAAIPQFTRPGLNNQIGVLASFGASINAGATQDRITSAWGGPATISVSNVNQTQGVNVFLLDPGIIAGGSPLYGVASTGVIWAFSVGVGSQISEPINLPYGPVVVRHTNTGGAVIQPTTTIIRGSLS
jgi:hypothetical protein